MKVEPLPTARYALEPTPDGGLRAVVPARRHWLLVLFLGAWMVGWAFGEVSALQQLLHPRRHNPDSLFLVVWLAGWSVGGVAVVGCILWQLAGRELISVQDGALVHRIEIFGLGRTRAYAAHSVLRLRVTPYAFDMFRNQRAVMPPLFGVGVGPVAFDYGQRTFRMAPSLDEAEAQSLVAALALRLPSSATVA